MIELIGNWLLTVTVVALLCATAQSLMPSGGVKQVGKLLSGLVMFMALLSPVIQNWEIQWDGVLKDWEAQYQETLEKERDEMLKSVIEDSANTYILEQAEQNGVTCHVSVTCQMGEEGVYLPYSVELTGTFTPESQQTLTDLIESQLHIPAERQRYQPEEAEP